MTVCCTVPLPFEVKKGFGSLKRKTSIITSGPMAKIGKVGAVDIWERTSDCDGEPDAAQRITSTLEQWIKL